MRLQDKVGARDCVGAVHVDLDRHVAEKSYITTWRTVLADVAEIRLLGKSSVEWKQKSSWLSR